MEADHEAILRVIEDETAAFWNKDFEAWARCWVQAPHVRRWGSWPARGGITILEGWEEQAERMRQLMAANPAPNRSVQEVRRERVTIRAGGDLAWVTFDQHAPVTGDGMDVPGLSQEMRILERQDGAWKIACVLFFERSLDHLASAVVRVEENARVIWINAEAETELATSERLAVRAGRLRAVDRSADQRLQAAIRWAARLGDGLYPRRDATPVVLEGGYGEPAQLCWVLADSRLVLVALASEQMTADRLAKAGAVYGLSAGQLRMAEQVVAGHDIAAAAARLGVSTNTARTHLRRIFDKTGVRSQPALVRALLSVASPLA